MKKIQLVKIMISIYVLLYLLSLLFITKIDRLMYIYSIINIDYFIWHIAKLRIYSPTTIFYVCLLIFFIIFFPIISFIYPKWDKLFGVNGSLHAIPISLFHNKTLAKKMQSKLFWYYCFLENNIKTPKVFFHIVNNEIIKINELDNSEYYIIKPNYGTQGKYIKKIKVNELSQNLYNDLILQEYVYDCFTDKARHFRINTMSSNHVYIFSIDERKQTNNKIASNHANGGKITICKNNNCDFLSVVEQRYIHEISNQLLTLHKNKFVKIPLIGWDICLTCNGSYVFEGNLGADIEEYNYDEYMDVMNQIYKQL